MDEAIDRGIRAQPELPPGVPMWPPRGFLARERTYTNGWHKWLLKQGESRRSENDRRIAEGDMLSVVALWLDYSGLTDKLALSAEDDGDLGVAFSQRTQKAQAAAAKKREEDPAARKR
jgi:hypothetical protein